MKMFKLSLGIVLITTVLFASEKVDKRVIKFETKRLTQNGLEIKSIDIDIKTQLPLDGWYGYVFDIKATAPGRGDVGGKDILFSNGEAVAMELINVKNGRSFKDLLAPKLSVMYYKKSHLIAGNENAKNKVVVFSDPLCPYCQDTIPDMINLAKSKADEIALYYYHFPLLSIHPAANALSKAMHVAKQKGIKDIELKTYTADFREYFNSKETDDKKILDGFNKVLKTNLTLEEINNSKVEEEIVTDLKMGEDVMVSGTPTIFVNGQNDKTRSLYRALEK